MQGTSGAGHLTEPQEVGCDLGKALIPRVQVEREGRQLVHKGNRFRVCGKIDVEQVLAARLTGLDPDVRKDGLLLDAAFSVDQPALQPSNDAAALPRRRPFFIEAREARTRRFAAAWAGPPQLGQCRLSRGPMQDEAASGPRASRTGPKDARARYRSTRSWLLPATQAPTRSCGWVISRQRTTASRSLTGPAARLTSTTAGTTASAT